MTTTIDNTQQVFLITGDMNLKVFCNLRDIPKAVKYFEDTDSIQIFKFWNNRQLKASKTFLNRMFAADRMKFKIS